MGTRASSWTPERRERQREIALKLHAQGKVGGAQNTKGRAGRPKRRAPSGPKLIRVLETAVDRSVHGAQGELEILRGRQSLGRISTALDADRDHFDSLLVTGVQALINDGQLPEFALVSDECVRIPPPNEHRGRVLKLWRTGSDAPNLVVLRELAAADVRSYTDGEVVECLVLVNAIATRPLLREMITATLRDLTAQALPLVLAALHERAGVLGNSEVVSHSKAFQPSTRSVPTTRPLSSE